MNSSVVCPECGSARMDHHHDGSVAVSQASVRDVRFAQVLNGQQWREKVIAPPKNRDDIVPDD
jgi:hypothetical protein